MTIKDIANIAGVSVKTVSKTINNKSGVKRETRDRILKIMEENNYSINYNAKRLSESKSMQIAIVTNISEKLPLKKNYLIMQHILEKLKGYTAIVQNSVKELQTNPYGGIARGYYDGIILLNPKDLSSIDYVQKSGIPFVISGVDENCSCVGTNQRESAYIAVNHLCSLGCNSIYFLLDTKKTLTAKEKILGYKMGLEHNGIKLDKSKILDNYFKSEDVEQFIKTMYYMKKLPDAILIDSDFPAFGAIRAIKKLKIKCPEELKIITFGNTYMCSEVSPSLTSIKQNFELIAEKLIEILLKKINDKDNIDNESYTIPAELIVRESTVK